MFSILKSAAVLVAVIAVLSAAVGVVRAQGESTASDRDTLIAFYDATGGEGWNKESKEGWKTEKPLNEWYGVSVDDTQSVTALNLPSSGLSGSLPPVIGDLTNLKTLNLSVNGLTGAIPSEIGKLANLETLDLSSNRLGGELPSELGNLTRLKTLKITLNPITGCVPYALQAALASADAADRNNLEFCAAPTPTEVPTPEPSPEPADTPAPVDTPAPTAPVDTPVPPAPRSPDEAALVALYNATGGEKWTNSDKWLSESPIGEWYGVSTGADGRVTDIDLSGNDLDGAIPREISGLSNLASVYLGNNNLSGEIPPELGMLSNLRVLDLSANALSGGIPPELGNLFNLQSLTLLGNRLSGGVPPELGNLPNLIFLYLTGNRLSGCVPPSLLNLPNNDAAMLGLTACEAPTPESETSAASESAPEETPTPPAPAETPTPAPPVETPTPESAPDETPTPEAEDTPTPEPAIRRPPPGGSSGGGGGGACSAPADGVARADAGLLLIGLAIPALALAASRRRWRI